MYSSSLAFLLLRVATWAYIGSLVAVAGTAVFGLCADFVAIALQFGTTLFQQFGG
jgi:hypothetical protein